MSRKRRRKLLPPKDPHRQDKKTVPADALPAPNHNAWLYLTKTPGVPRQYGPRFPLMQLMWAPGEKGVSERLLFVDPVYNMQHWADRDQDCAPSWMDPEVFVRMVLRDPRVSGIHAEYVKQPAAGSLRKMLQVVNEVFEQEYLVYLFQQFAIAAPVVARWVLAHREAARLSSPRQPVAAAHGRRPS